MNQPRRIEGVVLRLQCTGCGATFFNFQFSGDDDLDTQGLCAATLCKGMEIVIGELEPAEWNRFDSDGASRFEKRIASLTGRDDLHVVRVLRVESPASTQRNVRFQDFVKSYQPPKQVFSCPCCVAGESRPIEELSVEEFQLAGGRVITVGRLVL